eukprot:CAMPEP_0197642188 /NCGR_PEP_ID=MMETSP1338-20131121/15927_1 /TAXON_ID=43686 ORGANISM="Pelagodinium beii, Strain RCC1491" /NCGR_SAMPLE_ID=MMETSP1338 /ASSEMBLY_ACC=CAM_ASM_000754 /LENGTH=122 /DNA_ID=CAMNT_0043215277 /DNA_START=1 /DNA_END=366 /DNA_ORIENTATION=+
MSEDPELYAEITPASFAVDKCSTGFKMITCAEPEGRDFRSFVDKSQRAELGEKLQQFLQAQCFNPREHHDDMEKFRQSQGSIVLRQGTPEQVQLKYKCEYSFEAFTSILLSSMPVVRVVLSN